MAKGTPGNAATSGKRIDPLARMARYRRDERLWAWLFLGGICIVAPLVIVVEAMTDDIPLSDVVASSIGFFVVIGSLFAWSRRKTNAAWEGIVIEKTIVPHDASGRRGRLSYKVVARTAQGHRVAVDVTSAGFDLLKEGDMVVKKAGFNFPDKFRVADKERICMACGGVYSTAEDVCPRCGMENI